MSSNWSNLNQVYGHDEVDANDDTQKTTPDISEPIRI